LLHLVGFTIELISGYTAVWTAHFTESKHSCIVHIFSDLHPYIQYIEEIQYINWRFFVLELCFGAAYVRAFGYPLEVWTGSGSTSDKLSSLWCKVRVKCTLVQALRFCTGRTARRWSVDIALLFLDHSTRRGWVVSVTPRPQFTPGTVWTGGKSRPHRD